MAYTLETNKTWAQLDADIREQLSRWGCSTYTLTRGKGEAQQGKPVRSRTSWSQTPEEATVTLVANWPDKANRPPLVMTYNKQKRDVDNARVIFLAVESIRLNEVRGIGELLRETYAQLPPGPEAQIVRERDPYEVLGIREGEPLAVAEGAYKAKAQILHPDKGGSAAEMAELNAAIQKLREMAAAIAQPGPR